MCITEIVSIIRDIVLALSAGITAYVAWKGVEKWRSELTGKNNFEAARSLARATYRLRDQISNCRSPFVSGNEFPEEYHAGMGDHSSTEHGDAWTVVYQRRWKPVAKAIEDFDSSVLESEALWGKNIKEKTDAFRLCAKKLRIAIDAKISNYYSDGEDFKDKDYALTVRRDVSAGASETDNPLSNEIQSAIEAIEEELKPHLSMR